MPDIKLGPAGQELTLPRLRFRSAPSMNIVVERPIEEDRMSDGSYQYNFQTVERHVWPLEFDLLTRTQVDEFEWLRRFRTALRFQNQWDDETWYNVIIATYEREPLIELQTGEILYRVRMTLKEKN